MEIFWLLAEQVEIKATGLGELQAGHDVAESLAELAPAQLNEVLVKFATRIVAYLREE